VADGCEHAGSDRLADQRLGAVQFGGDGDRAHRSLAGVEQLAEHQACLHGMRNTVPGGTVQCVGMEQDQELI